MMNSSETIPEILVSAADSATATLIITEITRDSESAQDVTEPEVRVWVIDNKYYRAVVKLRPALDEGGADAAAPGAAAAGPVEAHVLYVQESRGEDERAAERRHRAAAADAADVRLLLLERRASPALLAWARRRLYEPVELPESAAPPASPPPGPFRETFGFHRVVDALHANRWSALRMHTAPAEGEGGGGEGAGGGGALLEQFLELLDALPDAAAAARAPAAGTPERRRRAEQLVSAFCRALELPDADGLDPSDDLDPV